MKIPARILIGLGAGAAAWFGFGRRAVLTWGATATEAEGPLPGDGLMPDFDGGSTRAITISAPPAAVWPWLVQIGPAPRGGAYTYDWIENLLGLGFHSVDRVLPEYQHPEPGESVPFGPNEMRFELVDPERTLVLRSGDDNWLWSFNLIEAGSGRTRLISRNRYRLPTLAARISMLPMEAGSLVMERRMLLGIRQRAEALTSTPSK
ncbi:MAG: hypothetical protein M9938_02370 [Solirubrobacterales bacterium]|nr:hypothetical protein [Solirubrobacterales bacterium]